MARILVVDDDTAQRFLFVQLLRRSGHDAIGAADAKAAFDVLASGVSIDAVLTDMVMPGLHGLEFSREIERRCPGLPVVMMSVQSSKDWDLNTNKAGVYFLQKPFERDVLTRMLHQAMAESGRSVAS